MSGIFLLIDFDGVIKIGDKPAPGISDFFAVISTPPVNACILSNSTLRTGNDIRELLSSWGVESSLPIITTIDFAIDYIQSNFNTVKVILNEKMKRHFTGFDNEYSNEAVLIGDVGEKWDYSLMNDLFLRVRQGAKLIALHKNKFWFPDGENCKLDIGGFIQAIEYATGENAVVLGKPSLLYFKNALEKMGYDFQSPLYSVGDDPYTDILPVRELGGIGLFVSTGKYPFSPDDEERNIYDRHFRDLRGLTQFIWEKIRS